MLQKIKNDLKQNTEMEIENPLYIVNWYPLNHTDFRLQANYQNLDNELRDLEWKVEDFQARYISDLNNPSSDSQAYELMKWEWQDLIKKVTVIETNQLQNWELDEIKNRISWLEANQHGH